MNAVAIGPFVFAPDRFAAILAIAAFLLLSEILARKVDQRFSSWAWGATVAFVVGARVGHVIQHASSFLAEPLRVFYMWQGGFMIEAGIALAFAYTFFRFRRELRLDPAAPLRRLFRRRIDEIVEDKATAELLKPWFRFHCKRPLSSDTYYPAFNQPNVHLVDVSDTKGVEALTATGFVHKGEEHPIDLLICASGFATERHNSKALAAASTTAAMLSAIMSFAEVSAPALAAA